MENLPVNPSNESRSQSHPPSLLAGLSVPEAVYKICSFEIKKFEEMLPVALVGEDIEGVHKVRVALRRMRTCIKFGKPYYHQAAINSQLDELKRIAQLFGDVRDLDVLRFKFSAFYSQNNQPKDFDKFIWLPLFGTLYTKKYSHMAQEANTRSIKNLGPNLVLVLKENRLRDLDLSSVYPDTAGRHLASRLITKISAIASMEFSGYTHDDLSRLHRLRLKAKSFRYLLEFFESILDAEAANRLVQTLIIFQDNLGDLNDTVVAQNILQAIIDTKFASPYTTAVEEYLNFLKSEQERLIHHFEQIWQEFIQAQPNRILEEAIAPLAHH